jgi:hypothetical protein
MIFKDVVIEDFDDVLYWLLPRFMYRFIHDLKYIPKEIKYLYQRITRGYDDRIYWNL